MLSVAILRGSLATRMDSVYTLASSAASHQRCHGLSVCMCVVGGGASLRKRKGHRDREREHVDKLGYVPLSQDNFTIYLSTETLKAPRSSDLEKTLRENPPPPSRWNCSFQITKANVANQHEQRTTRSRNLPSWWQPF